MKKTAAVLAAITLAIEVLTAETLPNGQDAPLLKMTNDEDGNKTAVLAQSFAVETKYGNLTAPATSKVVFYENGNVKSMQLEEAQEIETVTGKFTVNTRAEFYENGSIKLTFLEGTQQLETKAGTFKITATPSSGAALAKDKPLTFYENGTVKSAYLYGSSAPGERTATAKTSDGEMEIRTRNFITFYESGNLESAVPADGSTAEFLAKLKANAKFNSGSLLTFYESGKPKSFTPSSSLKHQLGFSTKARSEVVISEDGKIISCIPDRASTLKLDKQYWHLSPSMPFKNFEDNFPEEMTIDMTDNHFLFGSEQAGIYFDLEEGTPIMQGKTGKRPESDESARSVPYGVITLKFFSTKTLKSAVSRNPFVIKVGANGISTTNVEFNENFSLKKILLSPYAEAPMETTTVQISTAENPDVKVARKKYTSCILQKIYFTNGRIGCAIGSYSQVLQGNSKYYRPLSCIILFENGKIKDVVAKGAESLNVASELIFDDSGNPVAYTSKDNLGNERTFEIKK